MKDKLNCFTLQSYNFPLWFAVFSIELNQEGIFISLEKDY